MQGSFKRPAALEARGVDWTSMVHADEVKDVVDEKGATAKRTLVAPAQRLRVGEFTYFVLPKSKEEPVSLVDGQWLCVHEAAEGKGLVLAGDHFRRFVEHQNDPAVAVKMDYDAFTDTNKIADIDEPYKPQGGAELPLVSRGSGAYTAADGSPDAAAIDRRLQFLHTPDDRYAIQGVDYVLPGADNCFQVGNLWVLERLEQAERLDHDFAVRMQGLQNSTHSAVWCCSDMTSEAGDRPDMMEQFFKSYLGRFMSQATMTGAEDPGRLIREAVQMHQQFAERWVAEHTQGLAPTIEASAEALVGIFFSTALKGVFPPDMTWRQASRLLRRDPRLSPQFGLCLHFYMVKLEQDRGARNASYKSMFNASTSNILSLNSMDAFLRRERAYISSKLRELDAMDALDRPFSPPTADWYGFASQLRLQPVPYSMKRFRARGGESDAPPWKP